MPRGRAKGYELQREAILVKAAELFARQGYTATSMNEVAEACGVSKASLYHYVRDKHQLLAEITGGHIGRLLAVVADEAHASPDPEDRLRKLISAFLAVYASSQHEHRVLTEDVRFLAPIEQRQVLDGQRRVVAAFATSIAAARPELGQGLMEKPLAMLLFGMMNWMFTWLKPGGTLRHADMAPVVADLFFGGLAALRPPRAAAASSSASSTLTHHENNGDPACPSTEPLSARPSSPSASPRRVRLPAPRRPTSTSA